MAKYIDYMKNSELTWSDLSDSVSKKADAFENLYGSYSKAFDAGDNELADKYDKELDVLDDEIVAMIKKEEAKVKEGVQGLKEKEVKAEAEAKPEKVVETTAETKTEEPKKEESEKEKSETSFWDDVKIGMFD
tara:strand:+ start:1300 stop:1698 length:399 start_codon:yes stop_codon:yes gene_type:complete